MILKTRGWLRANRKTVFAHASILSAFLLFCLFLSGPLFDRFEAVQGESNLHVIQLPGETDNITYSLHDVRIGSHVIVIRGWAFIDGRSPEGNRSYVVLESDDQCYVFDTMTEPRTDVKNAYITTGLNVERSGLVCNVPSREISSGSYVIGIYIANGNVQAFQRTDMLFVKSKNGVEIVSGYGGQT